MHSKHWFGLGALLLTALLFARLGFWQLSRAEENRQLEARFAAAADLAVLSWPLDAAEFGANQYRRLRLTGRYLPEHQILLDNITANGQAGYQVLTPFSLPDGSTVLVNRGWLRAAADRSQLPAIGLEAVATAVSGRVDRLPRAALNLNAEPVTMNGVTVMSFPAIEAIEAVLERELADFQLLLDPSAPEGYARNWGPEQGRDERNIAYAVQWFGLMLLALVLAIGALWRWTRAPGEKT